MSCAAPDPGPTKADDPGGIGPDVDHLLGDFARYQRRRNLSPLTIQHRHHQVRSFALWLSAHGSKLTDGTSYDVDGWLDSLGKHGQPLSANTRGVYMSYLSAFYKFALREGWVSANPLDLMDRPKHNDRLPRPIDDDDLAIALDEAEPRMRAWLLLGALQGYRVSSMARLTVEGIDRRTMTLTVWVKGNREHAMPLHPDVLRALDACGMPSSGIVFRKQSFGQESEPLSAATISRYIGRFFHDLGSDATAHRLRHWFVTTIVDDTNDITVGAELAGHRSIETTKGYTKVHAAKNRAAMNSLHLAE